MLRTTGGRGGSNSIHENMLDARSVGPLLDRVKSQPKRLCIGFCARLPAFNGFAMDPSGPGKGDIDRASDRLVVRGTIQRVQDRGGGREGGGREDKINLRTTTRGTVMLMRPCGAHGPRKVGSRSIERIGSLQAELQEQLQEGQGSDPIRLGSSVKTD